uniref:NOL1/NOP2/Sun domain family member 4 n=1 Tax=Ascaris lumbricoides TaxID=6252 RepID=A0A9J2PXI0_ASCLU
MLRRICVNDTSTNSLLCSPSNICKGVIRYKRSKFKPKVARVRPLKTPSMLAMEHFDFYYGPMYGKRWPSIRLGLLTPNKYIAVVNTFSKEWETNEYILQEMGAVDLIKKLTGTTALERIEKKRKLIEAKGIRMPEPEPENIEEMEPVEAEEDLSMRGEAGLNEFRRSGQTLTRADLQLGRKPGDADDRDITITGMEGEYVRLPKKQDFIMYPRKLKLYSMPRGSLADFPSPIKDEQGIPSWWLLDGGSIIPVLALDLADGDTLLDMCAAPGGKSLLAIQTGLPEKVVCNDYKLSRLGQLRRALSTFLPLHSDVADRVILKRKDASDIQRWDEMAVYDKVLVDAPCSTDRLAANHDEGNMFAIPMTTERLNLPQLQTKLLINALRSVRVGGSVVYSTCTLSPVQNETVVENAVAIASERFGLKIVEQTLEQLERHLTSSGLFRFGENCRRGSLVVPFLPSNFGPMYLCKLQRAQ